MCSSSKNKYFIQRLQQSYSPFNNAAEQNTWRVCHLTSHNAMLTWGSGGKRSLEFKCKCDRHISSRNSLVMTAQICSSPERLTINTYTNTTNRLHKYSDKTTYLGTKTHLIYDFNCTDNTISNQAASVNKY